MKDKLRILAAADLHGDIDVAKKLSDKAEKNGVDLVLLAGDINGFIKDDKILEPFLKRGQKLAFVPGNWESSGDERKFVSQGARNLSGYYVTYKDVGIAGVGRGDWRFDLEKEDLDLIKDNFSRMKANKKILVSHFHAEGTKAEFSGFPGDELLRQAVEGFQPDLLISAHIHEAEGLEDKIGKTKVIQVGRRGKIIEI